jgi:pyruvate kinase
VPVVALTDREDVARRMCLYWGVTPILSRATQQSADALLKFVIPWGQRHGLLQSGSKLIIVGHTSWLGETHDLMMVHVLP